MQLSVITGPAAEPVTHAQVKTFMGYPTADVSQDTLIDSMITTAREYLEKRTGVSVVAKSYKAYFDKEDADDGWYELPITPVLATPDITVSVSGESSTFEQRGSGKVKIFPDAVYGTMLIGATSQEPYTEVLFDAGAVNLAANNIILELVSIAFNNRDGGMGISPGRLSYGLIQRINSISNNI